MFSITFIEKKDKKLNSPRNRKKYNIYHINYDKLFGEG